MNPFSESLLKRIGDPELADLLIHWDALQALVIRVFKQSAASPEDEAEYRALRSWLEEHYPRWQAALQPYWQQTMIGGETAREDPFVTLISVRRAKGFALDWRLMQTLPAAREALNQFALEQI